MNTLILLTYYTVTIFSYQLLGILCWKILCRYISGSFQIKLLRVSGYPFTDRRIKFISCIFHKPEFSIKFDRCISIIVTLSSDPLIKRKKNWDSMYLGIHAFRDFIDVSLSLFLETFHAPLLFLHAWTRIPSAYLSESAVPRGETSWCTRWRIESPTRAREKGRGKERERSLPTGSEFYLGRRVRAVALSLFVRAFTLVCPAKNIASGGLRRAQFGPFSTYNALPVKNSLSALPY